MTAEQPHIAGILRVQLIDEAVIAMGSLQELTGLGTADITNQALQAYAYLMAVWANDGRVFVKETPASSLVEVCMEQSTETGWARVVEPPPAEFPFVGHRHGFLDDCTTDCRDER